MKCPKCQFENREGAKFCGKCRTKLSRTCPGCQSENPPGNEFCDECGDQLTLPSKAVSRELSFAEQLKRIQRYLPGGLTKKILAQRGKIEGERRQVTVMFTDMAGFAPLVEKLGPEEAYSIMDQVYEILIHKVHDYEGTVNEMTGDGIMALFGAPIALEDAPQRAIRSALAIHQEINRLGDRMKQDKGISPIRMRIGINTGPVVVGTLGNDLRVEFKAVGDTVNLASRMEGLAEPGTTYVTEYTFRLTEGLFRFEALGEKAIKGKGALVKVYQVIAPSSRRTRFDVRTERGLTPFVGRERELELILDGFERVKEGRGQAFSIIGEAGIGKSRVLYEFQKAVVNENIRFLEGKCLSYAQGSPYHPIIDILNGAFDIREGDGDSKIRERVQNGLAALKIEAAFILPYILELLGVKNSGVEDIPMSPEGKKDRIVEALKEILLRSSELHPLVVAVEDLHWADKSTQEAIKYLLEGIQAAKVLLIFTYRPGLGQTWAGRLYPKQISLTPLSNRESVHLLRHLLGNQEIDKKVEKLILEKTEGIPFFIEELLNSLKELKILEMKEGKYRLAKDISAAIPSTVDDMIMARVDSLPDDTKTVLQAGAVIEREFTYELIKRVIGPPEEPLLSHLSALEDSELIYERGVHPKSTYVFRHALTRDVVYHSILKKKLKHIHEKVGTAIEEVYQNRIEEHYEPLVNHFMASGNYMKVAGYCQLACKKPANSMFLQDATDYARKWITALEQLPPTEEFRNQATDARTALGFYLLRMSNVAEAKEAIDPIVETVLNRDRKDKLLQINVIMGCYKYMAEENLPESIQYLEEAINISKEIHDSETGRYASYMLGLVLAFNCDFEKAISRFAMFSDLNRAMKGTWQDSVMKSNTSVYIYDFQGLVSQGYELSKEAVRISEESGDIFSKAMAYVCLGISCYFRGVFEEAEHYLKSGINYTEKINIFAHNAVAHQWLGHVYFDLRKYEKAEEHYSHAINIREHSRLFHSSANLNRIALLRAKLFTGQKNVELGMVTSYVQENKVKIYEGCMARYIADILLHLEKADLAAAEEWIGKAIEADRRNGMKWDLGRDYILYSEIFTRKREKSKVKENLEEAIRLFKEGGADGWARTTERFLSEA